MANGDRDVKLSISLEGQRAALMASVGAAPEHLERMRQGETQLPGQITRDIQSRFGGGAGGGGLAGSDFGVGSIEGALGPAYARGEAMTDKFIGNLRQKFQTGMGNLGGGIGESLDRVYDHVLDKLNFERRAYWGQNR